MTELEATELEAVADNTNIISTPSADTLSKYVITIDVRKRGLDILAANVKVWRRTNSKSFSAGDISLNWCSTQGCMSLFDRESHYLSEEELYTVMKAQGEGKTLPQELEQKLQRYYSETLTCGRCNAILLRENLGTDNFYVLPAPTLATRVNTIWVNTKAQADIHVRFYKDDFLATYKKNLKGVFDNVNKKMGRVYKDLASGREKREHVYYHLEAILKDIAAGKSLESSLTYVLRGA